MTSAPPLATSFNAKFVHDMRQPLSTIEACVFCLRTILAPDPETEEYLGRIEQQVFEASRILAGAAQPPALTKAASAPLA